MAKITDQVVSNETPNDHGYVVLSSGLDWNRYRKNPIFLYMHDWDKPIGFLSNIRKEGDDWLADFNFDEITQISKDAAAMYQAGTLRAASIAGKAYYSEVDGIRFATRFEVYEVSLVSIPANPDAVSSRPGDDKTLAVSFLADSSEEIEQLSSTHSNLIKNYLRNMEEKEKIEAAATVEPDVKPEAEVESSENKEAEELSASDEKAFARFISWFEGMFKKEEQDAPVEKLAAEQEESLSEEKEKFEASKETSQKLDIEEAKEKIQKTSFKSDMENMTIHEYLRTPAGREKFSEMARFSANREGLSKDQWEHDPRVDLIREFVHFAAKDRGFMAAMGDVKFSAPGTANQYGTLADTVHRMEAFASGLNSMNFVETNPDLAKIEWSTMLYRELFPDESWAARIPRLAAEDVAGVIWVNSAIKPKVYFGNRAPLNAGTSTYDDEPVGIPMKLFALSNITWQQANTDLLAYDDKALGMSEALRWLAFRAHNYYIQKLAEAASVKVATTGESFASAGLFPDNTSAAGNLKGLKPADILALQTGFINQNYVMETFAAEMVLPAIMNQQLQADAQLVNLLTKNAGAMRPSFAEYSGFTIRPRSGTTLYDTASNKVVDPELYLDGKISDDGTVPSYTAPKLAATAYSVALGFIPSEAIIGIGRTNVHMVADPSNYGWTMSMDMRTGAAAGRKGGLGIGLIRYAVNG